MVPARLRASRPLRGGGAAPRRSVPRVCGAALDRSGHGGYPGRDVRRARPGPIELGAPELSPDGRLAALHVYFDGSLPRLAVFDLDREDLVVLDRPDNEGWLSPSFSPSGDRLAFVRFCESGCAPGRQGFQISVYDRRSGEVTTVTQGRGLHRNTPLFSPDGRSIVYGSENLVWKEDFIARGLKWGDDSPFALAGGGTLRMVDLKTGVERRGLRDRFEVKDFSVVFPHYCPRLRGSMRSAVRIEAVDRCRIEFGQGAVQGASCGSRPGRGPRGKIVNLPVYARNSGCGRRSVEFRSSFRSVGMQAVRG